MARKDSERIRREMNQRLKGRRGREKAAPKKQPASTYVSREMEPFEVIIHGRRFFMFT